MDSDHHVENFLSRTTAGMRVLDPFPENLKPVLLIHGLGSEANSWQLQFGALARQGYRPLAPDLPGFGGSPGLNSRWGLVKVAGQLNQLLDTLPCLPVPVVGISMGGTLALLLALNYSEKVQKLVLVNTFSSLRPKNLSTAAYMVSRFLRAQTLGPKAQAEFVARRVFPKEDQAEFRQLLVEEILKSNPSVYRSAMVELARFNVSRRLKSLNLPVLVVSGDRDTTVPLINQKKLVKAIPDARHTIIPDAGHAVVVDQPEIFNQTLVEFLEET